MHSTVIFWVGSYGPAMHMLKASWQNVKQSTVINCFAKAGFAPSHLDEEEEVEQPPDGLTTEEFQTFVDMDSSIGCYGELTDEEISSSVLQSDSAVQPQSDDEEDESASTPGPIPKSGEVLQAIRTMRVFLELNRTDLSMFYHVERQVLKQICNTTTQTSIRDFFSLPSPEY